MVEKDSMQGLRLVENWEARLEMGREAPPAGWKDYPTRAASARSGYSLETFCPALRSPSPSSSRSAKISGCSSRFFLLFARWPREGSKGGQPPWRTCSSPSFPSMGHPRTKPRRDPC